MKIHQIKIDFNVTDQVKRYVFVYIIETKYCYMIDSGVGGSEQIIEKYIRSINRDIEDIKGIFLTHAHPDHIGTAAYFQEKTGCKIYASEGEANWIEDIDLQFEQRPIPNFYSLAGKSSHVDVIVKSGDIIELEKDIKIEVIGTAGHSVDEVSYKLNDVLFIGDTVPVKGDIPIYVNVADTVKSLDLLLNMKNIRYYYPAWDETYSHEIMKKKIDDAIEMINMIGDVVSKAEKSMELSELVDFVCEEMKMPMLKTNPLFERTVLSHLN